MSRKRVLLGLAAALVCLPLLLSLEADAESPLAAFGDAMLGPAGLLFVLPLTGILFIRGMLGSARDLRWLAAAIFAQAAAGVVVAALGAEDGVLLLAAGLSGGALGAVILLLRDEIRDHAGDHRSDRSHASTAV